MHCSDVRKNHGFPPEAACRSEVGCFELISDPKAAYNGSPNLKMQVLVPAGAIYYMQELAFAEVMSSILSSHKASKFFQPELLAAAAASYPTAP